MCSIYTNQSKHQYEVGDNVSCIRIREGLGITCDYSTLVCIYNNLKHQYRLSVRKDGEYYRCYFGGILDLFVPNNIEEFIKDNEK